MTKEILDTFINENPEAELKEVDLSFECRTGCGTCIQDANKVLEEKQRQQNPSPIEWVLLMENMLSSAYSGDWGKFLEATDNKILVQLNTCSKKVLKRYTRETSYKVLASFFVKKNKLYFHLSCLHFCLKTSMSEKLFKISLITNRDSLSL